ncbi:MAG: hypothetical protein KDA68_16525 [Planctomycetaceae bacterium]|nr:hypothetical protein [Planctomycetaceae bacterium]
MEWGSKKWENGPDGSAAGTVEIDDGSLVIGGVDGYETSAVAMSVFAVGGGGFDLKGVDRTPFEEMIVASGETLFDDRLGLCRGAPTDADRFVLTVQRVRKPFQESEFLSPVDGDRVVEKQGVGEASNREPGTQRVDVAGQQAREFGGRRHGGALPET